MATGKVIYDGQEFFVDSPEAFQEFRQGVHNIVYTNGARVIDLMTTFGPVGLMISRHVPVQIVEIESYAVEDSVL
ncbi:hypothetical protein [Arthrobacter sp. HLT1-21]